MAVRYAINIKTGSVEFRSSATEDLKVRFRPIPDEVAQAIFDGKISGKKVANVILKKITTNEDFDPAAFLADELKLNVRRNPFDFDEVAKSESEQLAATPKDMISSEELGLTTGSEEAPAGEGGETAPEKPLTRQQKAALTRAAKKAEAEAAAAGSEEAPAGE